jgi:hypothetical protein
MGNLLDAAGIRRAAEQPVAYIRAVLPALSRLGHDEP